MVSFREFHCKCVSTLKAMSRHKITYRVNAKTQLHAIFKSGKANLAIHAM